MTAVEHGCSAVIWPTVYDSCWTRMSSCNMSNYLWQLFDTGVQLYYDQLFMTAVGHGCSAVIWPTIYDSCSTRVSSCNMTNCLWQLLDTGVQLFSMKIIVTWRTTLTKMSSLPTLLVTMVITLTTVAGLPCNFFNVLATSGAAFFLVVLVSIHTKRLSCRFGW